MTKKLIMTKSNNNWVANLFAASFTLRTDLHYIRRDCKFKTL